MSNLTPPPLFSGGKKVPTGETPVAPPTGVLPPLPSGDFMPNQFHNRAGTTKTPPAPRFEVSPALSKTVGNDADISGVPTGPVEQAVLDNIQGEKIPAGKPSRKEMKSERGAEFDSFLQPVDPKHGGKVKPGKKVKEPKPSKDADNGEGKKKNGLLTWVLLATVIIIGAGAAYYFFLM